MRNMSFAMTTDAVIARTKTVTRRTGWKFLKRGDLIRPMRKTMGLKKGEKIEPLLDGCIRVTSVRRQMLPSVRNLPGECEKEGFPDWSADQFINMLCEHYGCDDSTFFTRIEFEYVEEI